MVNLRPIKQNEKIAVAIPTKNRYNYLAALLSSLIQQRYTNWMLVINDQSNLPVEGDNLLKDLFTLIRNEGHDVRIICTRNGWERHQSAMEAVPEEIEFIVRIDDDVLLSKDFLANLVKPFMFFTDRALVAAGGCYPEVNMKPQRLGQRIMEQEWMPTVLRPTWKLQGHCYFEREIINVESLFGPAMLYRRSAIDKIGGWAISGYSHQAFREESDASARLKFAGYELMVTTEALAWHLLAPSGGSREILKTPKGNFVVSERKPLDEDEALFQKRMREFFARSFYIPAVPRRYRISDLEKGAHKGYPLQSTKDRISRIAKKRVTLRWLKSFFRKKS